MRKKDIGKKVLQISGGVIGTVFDLFLYQTFLAFTLAGKRSPYQIDTGFDQAGQLLGEINHATIANSLYTLVRKGLIKPRKHGSLTYAITEEGKKRISETIPTYKTTRPWNGYLYLVSYDIPRKSNTKRNILRTYLKKIGCGKLQDSLWMSPYNPEGIIEEFVDTYAIPGTILVSKLGKDGAIGQENRKTLIAKVYDYKTLSKRYDDFIQEYSRQKHPLPLDVSLAYFAILKDDPQLPFPLEPDDFPARNASALFNRHTNLHPVS